MSGNADPEYATIGGLLLAPELIPDVAVWLRAGDFRQPAPRLTYEVMTSLQRDGQEVRPETVHAELVRRRWLRADGYPASELVRMVQQAPLRHRSVAVAQQVLHTAISREIARAGRNLADLGEKDLDPARLFKQTREQIEILDSVRRRWVAATNDRIPPLPTGDRRDPIHISALLHDLDIDLSRGRAAS